MRPITYGRQFRLCFAGFAVATRAADVALFFERGVANIPSPQVASVCALDAIQSATWIWDQCGVGRDKPCRTEVLALEPRF